MNSKSILKGVKSFIINDFKKQPIYDVAIIGGGIVGLATGRELLKRNPNLRLVIVEKENEIAPHQSSHNSGVIHCGIYYKPGSLRAKLCTKGSKLMYDYCNENDIKYENCGKLIVATKEKEFQQLEQLYKRGIENGVPNIKLLESKEQLLSIEPFISGGLRAIHTPSTGIIDYKIVSQSFANDITEKFGNDSKSEIKLNFNAKNFQYNSNDKLLLISNDDGKSLNKEQEQSILTRFAIVCGGMNSDRIAKVAYGNDEPSIVPFRGSFLQFKPEYKHLIKGNVYPLPNPSFPFLGVHFTKRINGEIWLGPNAVLSFDREGYNFTDFNLKDTIDLLKNPGLFKLAEKHWRYGLAELYRDFNKDHFIELLKPYMPNITVDMLEYGGSGVRSQAISKSGDLIEDFIFDTPSDIPIIHVRNSPSPAATSSLAIANEIVDLVQTNFKDLNSSQNFNFNFK
ncbi:hypothetical protein RB653_007854 [Dictyostelium firmibasis]|uniref:L-2-hydroxyglutarate dehydrogenase, mitochondrial n=1 Tax=Dictyostelium firmibasis TaxID=79012 RepID=A0AAN7YY59_9MYCE